MKRQRSTFIERRRERREVLRAPLIAWRRVARVGVYERRKRAFTHLHAW